MLVLAPLWLPIIICSLLLAFYIFWHLERRRNYWASKGIPGPKWACPLTGHYWQLRMPNKRTIRQLKNWTGQFGKFYGICDGPRNILVISDRQMVHQVLAAKFDIFEARKLNTTASSLSRYNSGSILHTTSFRWKRLRNITGTFFNSINIKKTIPVLQGVTLASLQLLSVDIKEEQNRNSINIQPYLQNLSDDILVRLLFGDSSAKGQPYFEQMCRAIEAKKRPWAKLSSLASTLFPWSKWAFDGINCRLATNHAFNNRLFECLAERVEREKRRWRERATAAGEPEGAFPCSFLHHHLMAISTMAGEHGIDGKNEYSARRHLNRYLLTDEIVSACINFLYAGHKTLARALTSVLYCLTTNLDIQQKLFDDEIANSDEEINSDSVERMFYLDLVIREALRLFPLGSEHVARKCLASTKLGDNMHIDEGDFVMVDVLSMHFDQSIWGENSESFDPSRWLRIPFRNDTHHYLSFGQGPRMCLGEKLAMLQMKVVLILLLKKFEVIAADTADNSPNANEDNDELMHKQLVVRMNSRQIR